MALKNNLIGNSSGNVVIFVALMFTVLVSVLGISVDAGRLYAVQSKAQNAADAALLGAVSTKSTTNLTTETIRLFNTNYPANYMGSKVGAIAVKTLAPGAYSVSIPVTVPLSIMKLFGNGTTKITVSSQVNAGYQLSSPQSLELALVFDNSGSANTAAMAKAGAALSNVLFNGAASLNNVHVSVIPFDTTVDVGSNRASWVQSTSLATYNSLVASTGGGKGFVSNRNSDNPPNSYVDVSDVAPAGDPTRFRVPGSSGGASVKIVARCFSSSDGGVTYNVQCIVSGNPLQVQIGDSIATKLGICSGHKVIAVSASTITVDGGANFLDCSPYTVPQPIHWFFGAPPNYGDTVNTSLALMNFGLNSNASIQNALNTMTATGGNLRVNVGLMWGWFTLSPNWQGLFNAGLPGLPANDSNLRSKQLVLVVSGQDNVYTGQGGTSNDDTTVAQLCQALLSKGIQVYTVGFGAAGSYNAALLQQCATGPTYTFTAANVAELTTVFQTIADDIETSTIRLSQ